MALRPVSELGLVEVTDVDTRATAGSHRRRKPPKPQSETGRPAPRSPHPARNPEPHRSRPVGVATSAISGAIGVAGAILVGRAILRR